MGRSMFACVCVFVLAVGLACDAFSAERSGRVAMRFDIKAAEGSDLRLWVPYPLSDAHQDITNVSLTATAPVAVQAEGVYGTSVAYAQWDANVAGPRVLELAFDARADDRKVSELREEKGPIPADLHRYLLPNRHIPTDGAVRDIARKITRGKRTVLAKARAAYNWTIENTFRDPKVKGCGTGSVERMLAEGGGKCADIHSVFVAVARAAGVPTREVFGLRLGKKPQDDISGGFHCWAEFYLPGTGWVPVDPADVRKAMLNENIEIKDAGKYREKYFGGLDEYRIALQRDGGWDIILNPPQAAGPVNFFLYPYAEAGGQPLDCEDPAALGYKITFTAQ